LKPLSDLDLVERGELSFEAPKQKENQRRIWARLRVWFGQSVPPGPDGGLTVGAVVFEITTGQWYNISDVNKES